MRVAFGTGNARGIVRIAAQTPQLGGDKGSVRVVDTEYDRFLVTQPVFPEDLPEILRDELGAVRQADVALEVCRCVVAAIWSHVASLIKIADSLFKKVGNEVTILDRLLQ